MRWLQSGVITNIMGGGGQRLLTWLPPVSPFLQAYFFDAPEMDHLPAAITTPNQTVTAAKSS